MTEGTELGIFHIETLREKCYTPLYLLAEETRVSETEPSCSWKVNPDCQGNIPRVKGILFSITAKTSAPFVYSELYYTEQVKGPEEEFMQLGAVGLSQSMEISVRRTHSVWKLCPWCDLFLTSLFRGWRWLAWGQPFSLGPRITWDVCEVMGLPTYLGLKMLENSNLKFSRLQFKLKLYRTDI